MLFLMPKRPATGGGNPTFRSFATPSAGVASSVVFTEPSGAAQDDILIALIYFESTGTVTPPAGWSGTFAGTSMSQALSVAATWVASAFWIRRGSSAPGLTFTFTSSYSQGMISAYSGCKTSGDPFSFAAEVKRDNASASTFPDISGTTLDADEMLVWIGMNYVGGTGTVPTGFTRRSSNSGSDDIFWADKEQASAGSTGTITGASWGGGAPNGNASSMLMGLRP